MEHKHNHSEGLENCLVCENDRLTKENADCVREQAIIDAATHQMGLALKDKEEETEALKAEVVTLTCCHNSAERHVKSLVVERDRLSEALKQIAINESFCYDDSPTVSRDYAEQALNHKEG